MSTFKLAISGGKGGVGKSMLASSFAILSSRNFDITAVDCDVDAPNLALWLDEAGDWERTEEISVSQKPVIEGKIDKPQQCVDQCRFNAFEQEKGELKLNPLLCEGCGACKYFCPAVKEMKSVQSGWIKTKKTDYDFSLIVGQLKVGETGSGKIVTELKERADDLKKELQIIDSAPGTGCPVVAALQDVDYVVLVTESTKSGLSDLKKVKEVIDHFNLDYGVVINKWDVNNEISNEIESWAGDNFLGKIGYEKGVMEAASHLNPIMESELEVKNQIKSIFNKVKNVINHGQT